MGRFDDVADGAYDGKPFIRLWENDLPELRYSVQTPFCDIGWMVQGPRLVIAFAIDNLLNGSQLRQAIYQAHHESDILLRVEDFFEAFHQKDTMSIKLLLHEEIVLKTVVNKGDSNSVISETIEDFLISLVSIPSTIQFKEDILSYKIEEDGALAHVWTPYHFFVNDKICVIQESAEWRESGAVERP